METGAYEYRENAPEEEKKRWKERYEKLSEPVERRQMVYEIRKAARQFAMLYFHFCKTLYDTFGLERTKELVRQTIFELAVDRSDEMRAKARAEGVCFDTVKDFRSVTDLPKCGWVPEWGADHCPYGQVWREYAKEYPWFLELAPYYCDVIDTTTIENFSRHLSHRLVQNVIISGESCEREYFESEKVREGAFTYGSKND